MEADSRGRVWVGTMAYDKIRDNGGLYVVDRGVAAIAVAPLTISNGPAIDERSGQLYLGRHRPRMIVDVFGGTSWRTQPRSSHRETRPVGDAWSPTGSRGSRCRSTDRWAD